MSRSTARQTPGQTAPQADPVPARPRPFVPPAPAPDARLGHTLSDFSVFPPEQEEAPVQRKANETGLPDHLKAGIESLSGMDMDAVNVHYNSAQPAALQAHAYAQGTDIHTAPGQEQHLPHEAWHVAQQAQGRVAAESEL